MIFFASKIACSKPLLSSSAPKAGTHIVNKNKQAIIILVKNPFFFIFTHLPFPISLSIFYIINVRMS
jgi:hypothetical protein